MIRNTEPLEVLCSVTIGINLLEISIDLLSINVDLINFFMDISFSANIYIFN